MNNSFKKWSLFLIPVTALGLIKLAYLSSEKRANQVVDNSSTVKVDSEKNYYSSVWDREKETSYSGNIETIVYRNPSCGCCEVWIEHAKKHGFEIEDKKIETMAALKKKYNIPQQLASCHTTIIDGYVIEGHIPADDIKTFLKEKSEFAGLAVPGMPLGTPGMEAKDIKQPFQVFTFDNQGKIKVFKEYKSY